MGFDEEAVTDEQREACAVGLGESGPGRGRADRLAVLLLLLPHEAEVVGAFGPLARGEVEQQVVQLRDVVVDASLAEELGDPNGGHAPTFLSEAQKPALHIGDIGLSRRHGLSLGVAVPAVPL